MGSLIDDLQDPLSLPDPTSHVTLVQTHISMVFIGDTYVYKIKKPVDFGFLDFSSPEKRHRFCEQEVRLNQRLSDGMYLGVLPVTRSSSDGRHRIGGNPEEAVDWAVRMKRIPEACLMKTVYERGELRDHHLEATAQLLARFHREAERSPAIDEFGTWQRFKVNTDENFAQTEAFVGQTLDRPSFERIRDWTEAFYRENDPLFAQRVQHGRIRDCHGDLHMEHICFLEPVAAIDCIEFNERFRYSDSLADVAFLLMDLEYRGGLEPADRLWKVYASLAEETGMEPLLSFYKVYRAYVRGKVIGFQLQDPNIDPEAKEEALQTARRYFALARSYVEQANGA